MGKPLPLTTELGRLISTCPIAVRSWCIQRGLGVYARPLKKEQCGVQLLALRHFHKLEILGASLSALSSLESRMVEWSCAG